MRASNTRPSARGPEAGGDPAVGISFPVVVIAGPTASGKTALSLIVAEWLDGEIVSFDSMQVYRDFDVGAAKPTPDELYRVPHHFIGEVSPQEHFTAGEYARRARPRILEIHGRGRIPVLVGGNGFYLRALLDGLFAGPEHDDQLRGRLRERAERRGPESLHRLLRRLDPEAAARIAPADVPKAIRALEVRLLAGQPMSELWRRSPAEPFREVRALKLGLAPPRTELYGRIDRRAAEMFAGPIIEETRRLLQQYSESLRVFSSHGYKQACDMIVRGVPAAQAILEAQQEQRNYAKRQFTWFRRDPEIHWLHGFGDDPTIQHEAREYLAGRLRTCEDRR
jgi:tRNA dimethylallyltransferase